VALVEISTVEADRAPFVLTEMRWMRSLPQAPGLPTRLAGNPSVRAQTVQKVGRLMSETAELVPDAADTFA